jgi:uncharacterized protein (DUF2132 family)
MSELERKSKNPLHGITLEMMLEYLTKKYTWPELFEKVHIKCFSIDPSIKSSLKFLRRTPWARKKVEDLFAYNLRKHGPIDKPAK